MPNITNKDKRLWNYYTSKHNLIKKIINNDKTYQKNINKSLKVLKPNINLTLDDKTKKQLYNKNFVFDAMIDLHGKTEMQAFEITKNFVINSFLNELKNIIIITGKGINNQGKLKSKASVWLKNNELSKFIIGFGPMPKNKGGEGALFVKLKNKNKYNL